MAEQPGAKKIFNPPPGWPKPPPGWIPDKDWRPDPAWPPVPPGWQLWLDAPAEPGHANEKLSTGTRPPGSHTNERPDAGSPSAAAAHDSDRSGPLAGAPRRAGRHGKKRWAWIGGVGLAVLTAATTTVATGKVEQRIDSPPPTSDPTYVAFQRQVQDVCSSLEEFWAQKDGIRVTVAYGRVFVLDRDEAIDWLSTALVKHFEMVEPLRVAPVHNAQRDDRDAAMSLVDEETAALHRDLESAAELEINPTLNEFYETVTSAARTSPGLSARTNRAFSQLAGENCEATILDAFPQPRTPPPCLPDAEISLSPNSGDPGTKVLISGRGFPPHTRIKVSGVAVVDTQTDSDANGDFAVESTTEGFGGGTSPVRAHSITPGCYAEALFDDTGTISDQLDQMLGELENWP